MSDDIDKACKEWLEYWCDDVFHEEVSPRLTALVREQVEKELAPWKEKDRVARGDPRRAAIFDWLDEHKDATVKSISDQNGEMELRILTLEAALDLKCLQPDACDSACKCCQRRWLKTELDMKNLILDSETKKEGIE